MSPTTLFLLLLLLLLSLMASPMALKLCFLFLFPDILQTILTKDELPETVFISYNYFLPIPLRTFILLCLSIFCSPSIQTELYFYIAATINNIEKKGCNISLSHLFGPERLPVSILGNKMLECFPSHLQYAFFLLDTVRYCPFFNKN